MNIRKTMGVIAVVALILYFLLTYTTYVHQVGLCRGLWINVGDFEIAVVQYYGNYKNALTMNMSYNYHTGYPQ